MTYPRFLLQLSSLYHWPSWSSHRWLLVIPRLWASWKRGWSWWEPWSISTSRLCLWGYTDRWGPHIEPPKGCILLFWMEDVHTLVIASNLLGKSCMTSLWIGWWFAFLSSISQLSLSLRTGMSRVLKIVVIPYRCASLQWLRYYEPSFIAYATFVFNKLKF